MENKYLKIFINLVILLLLINFVSCSDDGTNSEKKNGPTKIIITNKTDYEVKEIYYKQTSNFDSSDGFGVKLLGDNKVLNDKDILTRCPSFVDYSEKPYYFTFVRQNGSKDTDLYVTTDIPIYLSDDSGVVNLDLLPYNFYYTNLVNTETTCNDGQDGK
jgi:hypothetical protein